MSEEHKFDTIEQAIREVKEGRVVIVVDDENRENEGDFICAAECITPEIINFMASHGRGLICVPMVEDRCEELGLDLMVGNNTALHGTPFTVSVDLIGRGVTTGVSASDRAKTILALVNAKTRPSDLGKPGHVFPLKAKKEGVLRRTGHTEAAIDLARFAGFQPAGVLVEIMSEDGTMARLPELRRVADKFGLKLISIRDLIEYRLKKETLIEKITHVELPTEYGTFQMTAYRQINTDEIHIALTKGSWQKDEPILIRVHSSCLTGDIFGSCRCDCGPQLHGAMEMIEHEGKGAIVYMNQEGRGIGLMNKLKAYELQDCGKDTVEANRELGFAADSRDYGFCAAALRKLGVRRVRLLSNNPDKVAQLEAGGVKVLERLPCEPRFAKLARAYMRTKKDKMGHILNGV